MLHLNVSKRRKSYHGLKNRVKIKKRHQVCKSIFSLPFWQRLEKSTEKTNQPVVITYQQGSIDKWNGELQETSAWLVDIGVVYYAIIVCTYYACTWCTLQMIIDVYSTTKQRIEKWQRRAESQRVNVEGWRWVKASPLILAALQQPVLINYTKRMKSS